MEIDEFDVQEKISKIVQRRHIELSEIKKYFDINNIQPYKNIARIGQNLKLLEVIYSKEIYKQKCENIISITLSIGKIMDLNNSIKTILLSLKIFKEHKNYLQNLYMNDKKNFITDMFEKNNSIPLSQNNFIKERISTNSDNDVSFKKMQKFYESLYGNDSNFFNDLNDYYTFDSLSNNKENENDKNEIENEDSNKKLIKLVSNSYANLNKFYSRMSLSIESDYPSIIYSACDVFHMLYNKMMDNICYNPNFLPYIKELDEYILYYFIKPCSNDLIKLSEVVIKKEISEFNSSLIKFYGL
jgi:hypothetical protein